MNKVFDLLHAKNYISEGQLKAINEYQKLRLFSIRNELLFLLYISILLFTTGVGIIIYKNIDTIGHSILLVLLFLAIVISFYFSFKKCKGFSKTEVEFDNHLYNYLVLFTTILLCTFIGYFQYTVSFESTNYSFATLLSAIAAFGMAYYFDNKSALTIAITALASFIGLSLNIQTLFEGDPFREYDMILASIGFGGLLLAWNYYSTKINIKIHFGFTYLTFALHVLCLALLTCIITKQMYWFLFIPVLAATLYYFYKKSFEFKAISWYVFTIIYAFIGFNFLLFDSFYYMDLSFLYGIVSVISPLYFIGSIILFIKLIKDFNKKTNHDN